MKFTRRKRIALELLGPAFLGATLPVLFLVPLSLVQAVQRADLARGLRETGFLLAAAYGMAYVLVGLQSIAYTAIMEWRFARGLNPRSWRAVGWSTGLGFLSGAAIAVACGFGRSDTLALWLYFGGMGLAVGFGLGLLIKGLSPKPGAATEGPLRAQVSC